MATREEICSVCDQYLALLSKGDTEGIVALYDPHATVEDPLGTPVKEGHDKIREFYASVAGANVSASRLGPVTVVGHEAAFQFRIDVPLGEETMSMVATDLMSFAENGKIIAMRAYADADARPGT